MPSAIDLAKEMSQRNQQLLGRAAESAAGGLERISEKLRSQDLDGLVREAESLARSQPIVFFAAALAAGFLGVRYLKSSRSHT